MPVETGGNSIGGNPEGHPPTETPIQSPGNQAIPPDTTNPHANQDQTAFINIEKDIKSGEKWLIGIGIATILVNVIIACIYYGQLKEMRKATQATTDAVRVARDTLTATQNANAQQALDNAAAAVQAKAAADANSVQSTKSLQATIDNFHQEQRAWVSITGASNPEPMHLRVGYGNSGRTPALGVTAYRNYTITLGDIPQTDREPVSGRTTTAPPGVPYFSDVSITPGDWATFKQTHRSIYLYGTIWYEDIFHSHHWTQWCFQVLDQTSGPIQYDGCGKHTQIDH